ncbi:Transcription factor iws1 [Boothiomyces macroporosus]|uniref:Transcription factor iws1 n=1 Tax=Boothiomyces macroporosus TaxID=261099 RepID=A0AAD5Y527_9FUNG|nr:Transcription factor iws1 [Boothiomyces macroporosus]
MENRQEIDDIFGKSDDEDDLNDLEVKDVTFDSDEEQELPSFTKKDQKDKPKKKRKKEEGIDDKKEPVNEAQKDIDNILNRMKQRPKKLSDLQTEVQADEVIEALLTSMRDAAYNDQELNKNGQPAIAKLKLLQSTMVQLSKVHWFQALLDQNVLECIKFWLEPLTDGSLPSLDIQLNMMNLLKKRPILGKSNNHRHRKIAEVRYQPRQSTSHASYRREVDPNAHENRASLPVKIAADFTVAPVTNLLEKGGGEKKVDRFKKLKSTLRMKKK